MSPSRVALAVLVLAAGLAQAQDVPPPPGGVAFVPGAPAVRLSAPEARRRIDLNLGGHDLREVLHEVGRLCGVTIEVAPEVQERLTVSLEDFRWREAVDVLADMAHCQVEELGPNVLWVDQPALVTARFDEADVKGVLRVVGEYGGQQVVLGPGLTGRVSIDLKDEPWPRALRAIAGAVGGRVVLRPGLAVVHAGPQLPSSRPAELARTGDAVTLELDEDVANALEAIGREAGQNAVVDPEVRAHVRVSLRAAPFRAAVELVARMTRCEVEDWRDRVLVLTRPPQTRYDAARAPAAA
jgi:type II secretory pathway component GspD/PulD (secretin)